MDDVKIIEIKKSVFADNDEDADKLRKELKGKGVYLLNLMSSPGAGKTTTLIGTLKRIQDKVRVAVMEADIDSDVDAVKIQKATGIPTIQLHTGGMCHLDAEMTRQGLDNVALADVDLVILENVGNLVCPAEFDTGAVRNAMILSVPEGDDKPLKYPLMFSVCDLVLVNKVDVMPYFDFDLDKCREYVRMRNPKARIIPICAKTGEGLDDFADWLLAEVKSWKQNQ
jgi:hydrogenase nickel incorporation protein HypB